MPSKSDTRSLVLSLFIGFVLAAVIIGGAKIISVTNQLQAQRISACQDQNARHNATVARLAQAKSDPNSLIAFAQAEGIHVTPAIRVSLTRWSEKSAATSDVTTIALINALAPVKTCH